DNTLSDFTNIHPHKSQWSLDYRECMVNEFLEWRRREFIALTSVGFPTRSQTTGLDLFQKVGDE
ncbi:3416_t:CDS:1, partial [Paraglomus occultum]